MHTALYCVGQGVIRVKARHKATELEGLPRLLTATRREMVGALFLRSKKKGRDSAALPALRG